MTPNAYHYTYTCYVCHAPATCFGRYEGNGPIQFGCDLHCGHGNEDGWCAPYPSRGDSTKPILSLLQRGELTQPQAARILGIPLMQLLRLASAEGIPVIAYDEYSFEQELSEIQGESTP